MSAVTIGVPELIAVIVSQAGAIWFLIKFFMKREMDRVSSLEKTVSNLKMTSVSRTEFNETVKIMREEIKQGNSETHRRLDTLLMKMAGGVSV